MDAYDQIAQRFSFQVPVLYRELQAEGCFDCNQPDKYLAFTDHHWLSLPAIAAHEFCKWQTNTREFFVPFSHSARRDEWGWRLDWLTDEEPAIVFCERGPEGRGLASNFCGFLYRMLLEEFSGTWLLTDPDDEVGKAKIRRAVQIIRPRLPLKWRRQIDKLAQQHWYVNKERAICVYATADCNRIIQKHLAFPHLDEVFEQEQRGEPPF